MKPKYFSQSNKKPLMNRKPLQLQAMDPLMIDASEYKLCQVIQPCKQNKIDLKLNVRDAQEIRESSFITSYLKSLQSPNRTNQTIRLESQTADRKSRQSIGRHVKKLSIHHPRVIQSEDDGQYQICYIGNEIKSSYQNSCAQVNYAKQLRDMISNERVRTCDSKSEFSRYNVGENSVAKNKSVISQEASRCDYSKINSGNITSRGNEVRIKIVELPQPEEPLLDEWFQNKKQLKIESIIQQDPCYGLNIEQMYRYKDKSLLNSNKSKVKKFIDSQASQRTPSLLDLHRVYKEAKESSLKSYNQLVQLADKFMEKQKLKRKPLASHPVFKNQAIHNPQFRLCSRLKHNENK